MYNLIFSRDFEKYLRTKGVLKDKVKRLLMKMMDNPFRTGAKTIKYRDKKISSSYVYISKIDKRHVLAWKRSYKNSVEIIGIVEKGI